MSKPTARNRNKRSPICCAHTKHIFKSAKYESMTGVARFEPNLFSPIARARLRIELNARQPQFIHPFIRSDFLRCAYPTPVHKRSHSHFGRNGCDIMNEIYKFWFYNEKGAFLFIKYVSGRTAHRPQRTQKSTNDVDRTNTPWLRTTKTNKILNKKNQHEISPINEQRQPIYRPNWGISSEY